MPIDKRVASAAEALADVADGATVFISGFGGAGFPNMSHSRAARSRSEKSHVGRELRDAPLLATHMS